MKKKDRDKLFENLPAVAADYIRLVIKKMRYRKKVRAEVQAELIAHFEDALKDCQTAEEKEQLAKEMIADFGEAKLLAMLARRGKKRCRPLWRTIVARSFQVFGVFLLYVGLQIGWLAAGSPTVSVNYVEWMNELVRADRAESENAAPYYKKAGELTVKEPDWLGNSRLTWLEDFNDAEIIKIAELLKQNEASLEQLRRGTEKPNTGLLTTQMNLILNK